MLSADVEVNEAMDPPVGGWYTGYRLKTRVTDVTEITETARRITAVSRWRTRPCRRNP